MSIVKRFALSAGCVALLLSGCSRPAAPIPAFTLERAAGSAVSLPGRWQVQFTQPNGTDVNLCLVDFSEKNGEFHAEITSKSSLFPKIELKKAELAPPAVWLRFEGPAIVLDFRGQAASDAIYGTATVGDSDVVPARLTSTTWETLEGNEEPVASAGREKLVNAKSSAEVINMMKEFPNSPLILDAYRNLATLAKQDSRSEKDIERLVEEDLKCARSWGPELQAKVYIGLGTSLIQNQYLIPLGERLLSQATSSLTADSPTPWRASLINSWLNLGQPDKAIPLLRHIHEKYPYAAMPAWELAKTLEKNDENDAAIEVFAELAVLPGQVAALKEPKGEERSPQAEVTRLWKLQKKPAAEFAGFLKEIYSKRMNEFSARLPVTHRSSSDPLDRVALLEVLTGAECKGCVETDIAAAALQSAYTPAELAVIEYHTHLKGADVLANVDAAQRLLYYEVKEIPAVMLNGAPQPDALAGADGSIGNVAAVSDRLRSLVEPVVNEKAAASVQLSCKEENSILNISAEVGGLNEYSDDLRLRLVLVEDDVTYTAPNGVLVHHGVARGMPGGAKGIQPANGKLSYKGQFSLPKLKRELGTEITLVEKAKNEPLREKPLLLKNLRLVAFLQNDATKEVLQATSLLLPRGN